MLALLAWWGPPMKPSYALAWTGALLVGLGIRVGAACWLDARLGGRFLMGDSEGYWELGRAVSRGGPYQYGSPDARVFRAPGYPIALAPLFWIAGNDPPTLWARLLGALFGTAGAAAVGWVAGRLFGPASGCAACALAALEPTAIATSVLILSEALFCPLMVAHLGLWVAAGQAASTRRALAIGLAAGCVAGIATLTRPSWLLFTPGAIGLMLLAYGQRRRQLAIAVGMLLGLAATMLPWWVRNYCVVGRFVPTTLQVGASLYDGWNPQATGASDLSFVARFAQLERHPPLSPHQLNACFEYRMNQRLWQEAIRWARANPGRVAKLAVVKFVRMWNIWPNEPGLSSWPIRLAVLATYIPIMVLAILGAIRSLRSGWPYLLCCLPAAYFSLLHVVFVSSIRYRVPAMLMLIVLAGGVLGSLARGRRANGAE